LNAVVEFHPTASLELLDATDWYLERNPAVARSFVLIVDSAIEMIAESPERWPIHMHGTRRKVLRRFPYSIVYRCAPQCVQIIAVAHERKRPGYWRKRL